MYNNIKNTVCAYFYETFMKQTYNKVSEVEGKEEVYHKDNKLIVFIKDVVIRQRICSVIETLKSLEETNKEDAILKVSKYYSDNNGGIKLFFLDINYEGQWNELSNIDKLQETVSFMNYMHRRGFFIDESIFNSEECRSISAFLSFFVLDDKKEEGSKRCLIEYMHYVLSGGKDLKETYNKMFNENMVCKLSSFPYNTPVIRMFYNYFMSGIVPDSIEEVLEKEKTYVGAERQYGNSNVLITGRANLEKNFMPVENTEDYAIYGNMKIYHSMSTEFEVFIKVHSKNINEECRVCLEKIDEIIIDVGEDKIIGYTFFVENSEYISAISDKEFKNQHEMIDFISAIRLDIFYMSSLYKMLIIEESEEGEKLNIESSLFYEYDWRRGHFKTANVKDLYKIAISTSESLDKNIVLLFHKMYIKYLEVKYKESFNKKNLMSLNEVRYLSPILAKSLISYSKGKDVDYSTTAEELYKFMDDTRAFTGRNRYRGVPEVEFDYDSRFAFNPVETPITFYKEVEKKYGLKLERGMTKNLDDGRVLVMYTRSKSINELKSKQDRAYNNIKNSLGKIEDEHVKLVGISEVICTDSVNRNDMYNAVGYITQPVKGVQLSIEALSKLNNKELMIVAAHLFTKFNRGQYISRESIYMDDKFTFYIKVLDDSFSIDTYSKRPTYIECIIPQLIKVGYNANAFVGWNYSASEEELLYEASKLDSYCKEHGIYYNGSKRGCPVCLKTKFFVKSSDISKFNLVFEDIYAKHYNIGNNYNLKVYDPSHVNMAKVEKNIDEIINCQLTTNRRMVEQECFIPEKKVLDFDNKFIGYLYQEVKFSTNEIDGTCNDIKDPMQLKNLPRIKSLIRLLKQVQELMEQNDGFMENPFTHVFLSKLHKKQVQILNIDFLMVRPKIGYGMMKRCSVKELTWAYEYVCKVIEADPSIEFDFHKFNLRRPPILSTFISDKEIQDLIRGLQNLSENMTKYCSIHKIYYQKHYLFCPKCAGELTMEDIEVEKIAENVFDAQDHKNEGGESYIYDYGNGLVAKIFKEDKVNRNLKSIVIARVLKKKDVLEAINLENRKYKYVIPERVLVEKKSGEILGYVMNAVNGDPISNLRDKSIIKKLGFTRQDVFEILIAVGEGIEVLHANNIYIGDLNGRNILFDKDKNVYFLDFDGMGVGDIAPEFCTDGYIDPISKQAQNITMKDDWYSFAIQAFYYLTFTHPFNGIYSENGKKLDIVDKMERRISLIGNHKIEVPAIAEPWNWMTKELESAFLNIFEGERRESIVPYLVRQYEILYGKNDMLPKGESIHINPNLVATDPNSESKLIRVNSKFVATEVNPFRRETMRVINHYAAVFQNFGKEFITVVVTVEGHVEFKNFEVQDCSNIKNILLSDDSQIIFIVYADKIAVIDEIAGIRVANYGILDARNVLVNGRTLYYIEKSLKGEFIATKEFARSNVMRVKSEKIRFLEERVTKKICVMFNSKFVLVKQKLDTVEDEVYCNEEKLCSIPCKAKDSKYNIIYDHDTNRWLVVNDEGKGIIIKATGTYERIDISESVNGSNLDNMSFNKGIIYVPNQDCLHIINVKDQTTVKKMECNKVMTPDSKLYNINTNGFSVITNNMLYEVRKG